MEIDKLAETLTAQPKKLRCELQGEACETKGIDYDVTDLSGAACCEPGTNCC